MSFFDLFRPKWQNSNPETRAEAVRGLGNDDGAILARVAQKDSDPRVRKIAIRKLGDPALLGQIARSDPDEGLRTMAAEMASDILIRTACASGPAQDERTLTLALEALSKLSAEADLIQVAKTAAHESLRRAALARLTSDAARAEVARGAKEVAARNEALATIHAPKTLHDIALNDTVKETALAALTRLDDLALLESISQGAKNKAVRKAARTRLDALKPPDAPAERPAPSSEQLRHARRLQLIRTVEQLSGRTDWVEVDAALAAARASWAEIGPDQDSEDATLATRFATAERRLREQRALFEAAAEKAQRRAEAERQKKEQAVLDKARRAEEEQKRQEAEAARKAEKAEVAKREAEERAQKAQANAEVEAREAEERRRVAEERAAAQNEERQKNLARLEELCTRLEGLAETSDRKFAEKELKEAQTAFTALGALPKEQAAAARARYQAARERIVMRMRELEDVKEWERWANVSKLEKLCQRVEALREETDLKKLADEVRRAQADWKQVGPVPKEKSQALWQRFRTVCEELYGKCREHFSRLEAERSENVKKKQALCEQAEALANSDQWKQVGEQLKQLQADWKAVGPVPKKEADALWKRFRAACDRFFERRQAHFNERDEERSANMAKKEALCEQAEAAAAMEDGREGLKVVRRLQRDWKTIGPVPKDKSDELWQRFRGACDKVFALARAQDEAESPKPEVGDKQDAVAVQASWRPATLGDVLKTAILTDDKKNSAPVGNAETPAPSSESPPTE
ncbi:MAG TPA: DUF349 domain-containing protein [Polyangia bacterium]|nr:DUF349 domain-containing protein [Polyangia bacterium]